MNMWTKDQRAVAVVDKHSPKAAEHSNEPGPAAVVVAAATVVDL